MEFLHPEAMLQMLCLLAAANGAPILAKRLLGTRWSRPIDGGRSAPDGRPWLGSSKTWRGVLLAVAAAAVVAPVIGLDWRVGVAAGGLAMAGDLASSFLKRRLGLPSSSMALGIDQVPESLLPALVLQSALGLSPADLVAITVLFFAGGLLLSRIFYWIGLRDQPY
jgi:CDP-2,3-bis-(O-geranylgeranyl)-sn-glycerol synthase